MSVSFGTKLVASSPPTGLSARILSYPLLNLSWSQILDAKGYIIKYTPNDETVLVQGGAVLFENIQNLTQGKTYNIKVYSFKELLSESSSKISVLYDGKSVKLGSQKLDIQVTCTNHASYLITMRIVICTSLICYRNSIKKNGHCI